MAHSIDTRARSPAADLRADLEELDKLLVKVNAQTVLRTLELLDRAHGQMEMLRQAGVDLKAEEGLWSGFEVKLRQTAGEFVRAAKPLGGFGRLRSAHADSSGFWWHLDDIHSGHIRQQLFKGLRWLGMVAGAVLLVWVLLTYIIPPDETTVLLTDITYDLEEVIDLGDFAQARTLAVAGLERTDRATELLLWAGVIEEQLGETAVAQAYFDEAFAQPAVPPEQVWVTIGNNRMRVGDLTGAECAAQAVLGLDAENAQAHFLIAGVAEAQGDMARALEYFTLTSDLAFRSQPQLAVIARVRMGYLMQSPGQVTAPGGPAPDGTTAPETQNGQNAEDGAEPELQCP